MKNNGFYLGIDIGSTAVKAIVVDGVSLMPVGRGSCTYPTHRNGEFVTQSPHDWISAAVNAAEDAIKQCASTSIAAISVSAQGGSIFAADRNHDPITDAVSWMDARADAESGELYDIFGEGIYNSCGWRLSPLDDASKLLWLRKHDSETFESAAYFMTTADYFTGWLCGNYSYDPTSAAITRLYDITRSDYNASLMYRLGIDRLKLSRVLPCGAPAGKLTAKAADAFGITAGIPIYTGAHDQYCAAIGSGISKPGQLLLATGTAWVLFGVTEKAEFSDLHIAPGVFPNIGRKAENDIYGAVSSLSGIGSSVERFATVNGSTPADSDKFASALLESKLACGTQSDDYYALTPCEEGRGFLPHNAGSGIVFESDPNHTYDEKYLSLLEGAAFEAVSVAEKMIKGDSASVIMSGGAARSDLWCNIVAAAAATHGWSLDITSERDAPAFGAALIAAASCGIDIAGACPTRRIAPADDHTEYMSRAFDAWKHKILIQ